MGRDVSAQGDVYSYGILLMEMFTGKRPTNEMFTDDFSLHNYVKANLPNQVMQIVDPQIIEEDGEQVSSNHGKRKANSSNMEVCLEAILQVGVSCSVESPSERIDIGEALVELNMVRNEFLGMGIEKGKKI